MTLENQNLNRTFATVGDGVLLIWWGIVIMVGPITVGMGAIGTGLICLGVNAARMLNGIPPKARRPQLESSHWYGGRSITD